MKFKNLSKEHKQSEIERERNRIIDSHWDQKHYEDCLKKYGCEYSFPMKSIYDDLYYIENPRTEIELYFGDHWPMDRVKIYAQDCYENQERILKPILELYEDLQDDLKDKIAAERNALFESLYGDDVIRKMLIEEDLDY